MQTGRAVRYDFRVNAWTDGGNLADDTETITPTRGGYTASYQTMNTWFPYFHGSGYGLHYNFHLRAQGISNPSTPDGTFVSPVKETPVFYCSTGLCRFP